MKDKSNTTWHAIKQGFLIVFIIVSVFLSFGIILFALCIKLDDEEYEYGYDDFGDWVPIEKEKEKEGKKK